MNDNQILSINVEYNTKEIISIVVTNILKMLERRGLLDNHINEFNKLESDIKNNKTIFNLVLNNKSSCSINLISTKIASIAQNTPLDEYLSTNLDIHKIIIIKDITKKVIKQILTEYKNSEVFFEHEMLEDIPAKIFIPEHKLLTSDEKKELLSKFSELDLAKIFVTDIMSRYYGAKIGDIFRIIRPSIIAGNNVFYRRVVTGTLDILFS